MQSLKEAMKYMTESQGFDRVLRKVRAPGGQGSGSAAPPEQLVYTASMPCRNKGLNRDRGVSLRGLQRAEPRRGWGTAGARWYRTGSPRCFPAFQASAPWRVAVLLTRGRKQLLK